MEPNMSSPVVWRPLPLKSNEIPSLLVSVAFGSADYSIRVTDMVNVWQEDLGRREILMRSLQENTSIDPSERGQMSIFLDKIASALTPWHSDHHLTSATLSLAEQKEFRNGSNSTEQAALADLVLNIICRLPPGIPPLKWHINLKKMAPSFTATELVLPLIEAQYTRQQEVRSLVELLGNKDAVITKLLDKLESSGIDMDQIFNNLQGKKRVTTAMAMERVKGLAPFAHQDWKSQMDGADGKPENVPGLLRAVFDHTGLGYKPSLEICDSPELNGWWTNLRQTAEIPIRDQIEVPPSHASPPAKPSQDDDDDFQVQATPPHLASSNRRRAADRAAKDEPPSAAEQTEVEVPDSVPAETSPEPKRDSKKASKLGAIGKGKRPPPEQPPPPAAQPDGDDTETASEVDEEPVSVRQESSVAAEPAVKTRGKGGLGRIGGPKPKPATKVSTPPPQGETDTEPAKPSPRKLGTIGKKHAASEEPEGRGRATRAVKGEDDKEARRRETSEERADRKREELRLELERKQAAGPAKKKRRF